jgi:hypothetical protein
MSNDECANFKLISLFRRSLCLPAGKGRQAQAAVPGLFFADYQADGGGLYMIRLAGWLQNCCNNLIPHPVGQRPEGAYPKTTS